MGVGNGGSGGSGGGGNFSGFGGGSGSLADASRGAPRDWNEEFQLFHELPAATVADRLTRAKLVYKLWLEFQEAAVAG